MAKSWPMFSKLPQEIQDRIWERSLMPSPCVQRLEIYQYPLKPKAAALVHENPELPDILKETMLKDTEAVTFLLHSEEHLIKQSPYYSTVQVARACQRARNICDRLITQRIEEEQAEEDMLTSLGSNTAWQNGWAWQTDKDKTITTVPALQMVPVHKGNRRTSTIAAVGSCSVPLNLMSDVLCVDLKWSDEPNNPSGRKIFWKYGHYSRYLVPLRQLAVEFSTASFKKCCKKCERLIHVRSEYERMTLAAADHKSKRPWCLLCKLVSRPDLADLSTAQKKEVRHWLKSIEMRELIAKVNGGTITLAQAAQRRPPGPEWDMRAFPDVFPLLQRASKVMERLRVQNHAPLGDRSWCMTSACLDDFDGDTLALWNYSRSLELEPFQDHRSSEYDDFLYQAKNYDVAGKPICLATQDSERGAEEHERHWCEDSQAVANFFPLTTPQLQTMYVIDRRIKLKAGASMDSIPSGARTFRGVGCVYVEAQHDQHKIWEYPEAETWGATAFDFARHLRENMRKNQAWVRQEENIASSWDSFPGTVRSAMRDDPNSPHRRAIDGDTVPECKVLAVVDLKRRR